MIVYAIHRCWQADSVVLHGNLAADDVLAAIAAIPFTNVPPLLTLFLEPPPTTPLDRNSHYVFRESCVVPKHGSGTGYLHFFVETEGMFWNFDAEIDVDEFLVASDMLLDAGISTVAAFLRSLEGGVLLSQVSVWDGLQRSRKQWATFQERFTGSLSI